MAVNVLGGGLAFDAAINDSQFQAQINRMERDINRLSSGIVEQSREIDNWAKKASVAVASYFSVQAASGFVREIVNIRGEFQQLEIAFSTMLKSKEKADSLMKDITQFAATTPFDLKQVAAGTKQLLAYGFAAQDMNENLSMLGNVASGVGSQIGDLIYLYGTLKASGRVTQMDINQFAGRGIPIYAELAKVLGVNVEQVREFVSAGKIGFPQIEKAFKNMTNESGMFYNLMQEQSKSLTGQISNLGDAFDSMMNDIGRSNQGILSGGIEAVAYLVENYTKVLEILEILIVTYGAYRAALIVSTLATTGLTIAETLHYGVLVIVAKWQAIVNKTMLANPYVAVATVVAGLVYAMWRLHDSTTAQEKAQRQLNASSQKAAQEAENLKNKVTDLNSILRDKTATDFQQTKAFEELKAIYPDLFANLTKEAYLKKDAAEAQRELNAENDKMSVANIGKRYLEAKNQITQLNEEIKKYNEIIRKAGDQGGGLSKAISDAQKNLEVAKITANQLGKEFAKSQEDLKISLMSEKQKITYYENQQKSLVKQKDAMIELHKKSGELNTIFNNYSLFGLNKQITDITNKIASLTTTSNKRTVKVIDADLEEVKEDQKSASNHAEYLKYQKEINRLEAEKTKITGVSSKTEKKGADDKIKILEEITKAENEAHLNKLQSDEREIQSTKLKYEELRKEAKKAGLGAGAITRIDRVEQSDLGYLEYDRETDKLEIEIAKQKDIFQQYEEYRISLGKDAADTRFESEKAAFDDYGKYIDSKMSEFVGVDISKLTGSEKQRYDKLKKESDDHIIVEQRKYDELLKSLVSYQQQRKILTERYNKTFAELENNPEAQEELTKNYNEDLRLLDESQIKKWESYKDLFDHLEDLNKKELANRIQLLKDKVAAEVAAGNITIDQANKVYREINAIGKSTNGIGLELVIQRLRNVAGEISSINNDIGSIVGSLANAAASYISISKDIQVMNDSTASQQDQDAAKINVYAQVASGLLSMVTSITDAAARRKRVTEEFYRSAINFQNQYNLTLIEQARLENINKRGIFSKDSLAELKDGVKASGMAMVEYQKKLDDLAKGQAKTGLRNAVDWKSVGSMTATGVGVGAAIGSIVPVIGTAIGAVVGGVVGFVGGLFGTKKKKDTYAGLLSEFPELIMKSADGTRVLNTGLAQQLIAQNQVNAATKDYLQAAIDAEKGLAAAREQVNEGIKTLVGSIDDDLRNSLVNAFKAGEDGMKAFESTVGKSMENIIANLAFQAIFNDAFKELEDGMKSSFGLGGDNNIVDDLQNFYKLYGSLTKDFDAALTAASQAAKQSGIEIFTKEDPKSPNSLKGAYSTASQESITLLAGHTAAMRMAQLENNRITLLNNLALNEQNSMITRKLIILNAIEENTRKTAENTNRLEKMESSLVSIDRNISKNYDAAKAAGLTP